MSATLMLMFATLMLKSAALMLKSAVLMDFSACFWSEGTKKDHAVWRGLWFLSVFDLIPAPSPKRRGASEFVFYSLTTLYTSLVPLALVILIK